MENKLELESNSLIFRCFASGSSGNCYYLGTKEKGILIDAGISARTIQKHLKEMGLDFTRIMGVLVTHAHADHIRAVGTIGERYHVPIYSTEDVHIGIDNNYGVQEKLRTSRKCITLGETFAIADMQVNTFYISHDSSGECLGYVIYAFGQYFMIATDCGEPNPIMERAIRMANHIVIEANHDEQMLLNGPYPTYLKQRILSPKGHQSNRTCAKLLADNYHEGIRNVFLCHLSQDNNDVELAYNTIYEALAEKGVVAQKDYFLKPLDRLTPSPIYQLNNEMICD